MFRKPIRSAIYLIVALSLLISGTALAAPQAQDTPVAPCVGERVTGTVTAVDVGTRTVTIQTNTIEPYTYCTVTLGEYDDDSIDAMLGRYFGEVNLDDLELGTLVDWPLDGPGDVHDVTEQIADFRDEGLGYGVIVKLFALAARSQEVCSEQVQEDQPNNEPCVAVTAEELKDMFKSGTGMGQLFKLYGKPDVLGVGHVRHADKEKPGKGPKQDDVDDEDDNEGTQPGNKPPHMKPDKQNNNSAACAPGKKNGKGNNTKGMPACP